MSLLPKVGEIVKCKVSSKVEMGYYVQLIDYENREGMILLSELKYSYKNARPIPLTENKIYNCLVIRIDKDNIDLSYKKAQDIKLT